MKDELPISALKARSLEERFRAHPESYQRLQAIADMMEASIKAGCSADQAEERAIEEIRKLGQALLSDWAQKAQQQSLEQAKAEHPAASNHVKKK